MANKLLAERSAPLVSIKWPQIFVKRTERLTTRVLTSALSFDLDQRLTGEHVMLALRKTEDILAMFTKVLV
jgi:hypothetical protein